MTRLAESALVEASLAEAWEHYFDPRGWPGWVDGFEAVAEGEGYPEVGSTLRWRSTPAGRGTVTERVLEHESRRLHRIAFSDPGSEGELSTSFTIEGSGTRVEQRLDYRLSRRGPLSWLTDRIFVRSQMGRAMERSLIRFKHEAEERARAQAGPR